MKDKNATDVQKAQVMVHITDLIIVGYETTSFEADSQFYVRLSRIHQIPILRSTISNVDNI